MDSRPHRTRGWLRPAVIWGALLGLGGCAGHYDARRGESALLGHRWPEAIASYTEAVRKNPNKAAYRDGLLRARRAAAEDSLAAAAAARQAGDLRAAIDRCELGLRYWSESQDALRLRDEIRREWESVGQELAAAQREIADDKLDGALDRLRAIARYAPTFPELAVLLPRTEARVDSRQATARGVAALSAGNYRDAVRELTYAVERDPENREAQAQLPAARKQLALQLQRQAEEAERARQHGRAIALYREAESLASDDPAFQATLGRAAAAIVDDLARTFERQGDAAFSAGLPAAAWAWYHTAAILPGRTAAAGPPRELPSLTRLLQYAVALEPAGAAGQALAAEALAPLQRDIRRAHLDGVEITGGVGDGKLVLELDAPRIDHETQIETREAPYVERIETRENPQWIEARRRLGRHVERRRALEPRLATIAQTTRILRDAVVAAERSLTDATQRRDASVARELGELERRVDHGKIETASLTARGQQLEQEIRNYEELLSTAKDPMVLAELQRKLAAAKQSLAETRARLAKVGEEVEAARRKARQLRESPPESAEMESARGAVAQARESIRRHEVEVRAPAEAERNQLDEDVRMAEGELQRTPATVQVPIEAVYRYPATHHRVVHRLRGRVLLVDHLTGEQRLAESLSAKRVAEDVEVIGVRVPGQPDLIIPPDPLELPDPNAGARELAVEIGERAAAAVIPALRNHGVRFAVAARRAQQDTALHHWVLGYKSGHLDAADAASAAQAVLAATGLDLTRDAVDLTQLDGR